MSSSSKEGAVRAAKNFIVEAIVCEATADRAKDGSSLLDILIDQVEAKTDKTIWIEAVKAILVDEHLEIRCDQWRALEDIVLLCSLFDNSTLDILEKNISEEINNDVNKRLFIYHVLSRGGKRALASTLSRDEVLRREAPYQWFDLMQETLPFTKDRKDLFLSFVREGMMGADQMSIRLELVRSLSGQYLSDFIEEIVHKTPSALSNDLRLLLNDVFGLDVLATVNQNISFEKAGVNVPRMMTELENRHVARYSQTAPFSFRSYGFDRRSDAILPRPSPMISASNEGGKRLGSANTNKIESFYSISKVVDPMLSDALYDAGSERKKSFNNTNSGRIH